MITFGVITALLYSIFANAVKRSRVNACALSVNHGAPCPAASRCFHDVVREQPAWKAGLRSVSGLAPSVQAAGPRRIPCRAAGR